MAAAQIRPDWTVGKLTLVAGSKDFTTTGSALEAASIQGGDEIITASGHTLIIDKITGQNAGTLMEDCPADAAGADQSLRIRFQPDGSRYNGATADLVRLLGSGNVYAFSELVGVEGGVPVFTGVGTMDIVPKSEFGPADTNGNLTELAALAKENDQFIVMGADGKIAIKSIKSLTDEIDKKYQLPEGGTAQQLLGGAGGLIDPAALPVSTATQDALDLKASTALVGTKSSYNWIINGDFTINQRGGVKKPANGVYGFDRWKGHANGIEQIVEALPAGEYTLTWSGGGNGSFGGVTKASPIKVTVVGGNASVIVPEAATKISLVHGDAASKDPWEARHYGLELTLAQRYFQPTLVKFAGLSYMAGWWDAFSTLAVHMRATPTLSIKSQQNSNASVRGVYAIGVYMVALQINATAAGFFNSEAYVSCDAEFY